MKEPLYKVINNSRNTNWKVGALIKRISSYNSDGFAMFSDPEFHVVIWAHMKEVEINS
jgi:hypothetical protein